MLWRDPVEFKTFHLSCPWYGHHSAERWCNQLYSYKKTLRHYTRRTLGRDMEFRGCTGIQETAFDTQFDAAMWKLSLHESCAAENCRKDSIIELSLSGFTPVWKDRYMRFWIDSEDSSTQTFHDRRDVNDYISIIICTYNRATLLQRALESLACQTLKPDQLTHCISQKRGA